jgi:hypothetical protein
VPCVVIGCQFSPVIGKAVFGQSGPLARMTLHARLLSTDDEQNAFARLLVQRSGGVPETKEFRQHHYVAGWARNTETA